MVRLIKNVKFIDEHHRRDYWLGWLKDGLACLLLFLALFIGAIVTP